MNKCKGCQWYGKPYWSIINPCDNCPRENTNVEIITRWQDPTIEKYQKEIDRLNNIINELEKWLKEDLKQVYRDAGYRNNIINEVLDKLKELKDENNE